MYYDPFIMAARHGSLDTLKFLLEHYYIFLKPVGRTDIDGRCCRILNAAAHGGHLEVVKLLPDHGADISVKHLEGNTPLHEAADGMFWPEVVEGKYKPMGEILRRLQGDEGSLMDELDTERKSPRHIQSERRNKFMEQIDGIENEWRCWGL
jgi:hypothetical protein